MLHLPFAKSFALLAAWKERLRSVNRAGTWWLSCATDAYSINNARASTAQHGQTSTSTLQLNKGQRSRHLLQHYFGMTAPHAPGNPPTFSRLFKVLLPVLLYPRHVLPVLPVHYKCQSILYKHTQDDIMSSKIHTRPQQSTNHWHSPKHRSPSTRFYAIICDKQSVALQDLWPPGAVVKFAALLSWVLENG